MGTVRFVQHVGKAEPLRNILPAIGFRLPAFLSEKKGRRNRKEGGTVSASAPIANAANIFRTETPNNIASVIRGGDRHPV